jgi:putative hydrolase of the HAD superfamily
MIKALVLDADGVLINARRFSLTFQEDYGVSTKRTLPFFMGKFQECLVGKADLKEELKNHLKSWGWEKSADEFLKYWFSSEHKIDEELINYVKNLKKKGTKCYVATNNEKYRTEYIIKEMGFGTIFDEVIGSGQVGHLKPTAEFYKIVVTKAKVSAEEIVFWDDDIENVEGARRAGLHAQFYSDFLDFQKKMKHYLKGVK